MQIILACSDSKHVNNVNVFLSSSVDNPYFYFKVWSNQLESEATTWASRCTNGHQNNGRGENIAMLSVGEDISQLVRQGVKMWNDEKNNYYPGMGLNAGTAHYTQVA